MAVAISNTSLDCVKNNDKKNKIKYPKTYTGTTIGAALACANIMATSSYNHFRKQPKNSMLVSAISFAIITLPGAVIDYVTNKRRKNFAVKTAGMNEKEALKQDKNAYVTQKLNPYVKSDTGKKLGPVFGSLYTLLSVVPALSKCNLSARSIFGMSVASACTGAAGGLALGFLNDFIANRSLEKKIDKIYG